MPASRILATSVTIGIKAGLANANFSLPLDRKVALRSVGQYRRRQYARCCRSARRAVRRSKNLLRTLIPVAQTDRILSGIATAVIGADKAYSKKELLSNTIQALQIKMRADRKTQAAAIYSKILQRPDKAITTIGQPLASYEREGNGGSIGRSEKRGGSNSNQQTDS
jgi:hypothetical protein